MKTHVESLEEGLDGSRLPSRAEHAPLVALLRTLAAQMDAAGVDPSTRLVAAYLSALKDMRRAIAELPPARSGPGRLEALRANRPMPLPSKATGDSRAL